MFFTFFLYAPSQADNSQIVFIFLLLKLKIFFSDNLEYVKQLSKSFKQNFLRGKITNWKKKIEMLWDQHRHYSANIWKLIFRLANTNDACPPHRCIFICDSLALSLEFAELCLTGPFELALLYLEWSSLKFAHGSLHLVTWFSYENILRGSFADHPNTGNCMLRNY